MREKFYSSHWLIKKKKKIFFFSIVKVNENYAEICRVGNMEADFNKFRLFNFF